MNKTKEALLVAHCEGAERRIADEIRRVCELCGDDLLCFRMEITQKILEQRGKTTSVEYGVNFILEMKEHGQGTQVVRTASDQETSQVG